jgi:quinol monooxygenase YgiN
VNTFGLYSKIRSQAGQRDDLVAVLLDAAAVLQQVSGCQLYIVSVSATESETVWVTEAWRSQADHEASLTREDIRPILMRGRPLIAGFERIEIKPIGGKVSVQMLSSNRYLSGDRCDTAQSSSHFCRPNSALLLVVQAVT